MNEQDELRTSVRRFLADRAPLPRVRELMETEDGTDWAVWEQAGAQLGLQGIAIPEAYGGAGFTFAEQAIVLEEFGAALYGGPYLASGVLAATALLASPDEGDRLAGRDVGQQPAPGAFVVARQQRRGGQHGAGQVRAAVQRGAELLEHDRLLGEGEAGPSVALRDGQALQAELDARLPPDGPVRPVLGLHELPDPPARRPVRQEAPDRSAQLLLLSQFFLPR